MQNVKTRSSLHIDLFSNLPVLDARWKKLRMSTRLSVLVLLTWLPLLIFSLIEGSIYHLDPKQSFLNDYGVHLRFLIAMPLLLLSCMKSGVRIRKVLQHFIDADIIGQSDRARFELEINQTMKLRDSRVAKVLLLVFIYLFTIFYFQAFSSLNVETWRTMFVRGSLEPTRAGWWFMLISQPLYFYALFYFLYRVVLWGRLLFKISRMKLRLTPIHGDGVAGLGFLERSVGIFVLPVFAISTSLAGGMINLVLYENFQLSQLKMILMLLVGFYMLIFLGPLCFFSDPLKRAKQKAIMQYGVMVGRMNHEFEQSELMKSPHVYLEGYETVDASNSTVERIHEMRVFPVKFILLLPIILAMLIPFLPVVALEVPWSVILERVAKLLL